MIAHQVAGKATRDAIFLSHYDVTDLPKMVLIAAVLSLLAVVLMARLLASYGPWRVIPMAFFISGVLFAANWWYYAFVPDVVAIALYLQMAIFGAVLISGFWSVVNERFDPHTAKQTIAAGGRSGDIRGCVRRFSGREDCPGRRCARDVAGIVAAALVVRHKRQGHWRVTYPAR